MGRYASTEKGLAVEFLCHLEGRMRFLAHGMMALYLQEMKDSDIEEEILIGHSYED